MKNYADSLKGTYSLSEAKILVRELLCHITGLSTTQLLTRDDLTLTQQQSVFMDNAVERLNNHEPIQHVLGYTLFHGNKFICDKRALIPRPETEELVDWIIEDNQDCNDISILDIGTGTGCIAISLSLALKGSKVSAMDISLDALDLARQNASNLKSDITFINDNILKAHESNGKYSIIVSNPPYVRECEKVDMDKNVLDYDPSLALFVSDEDPLIFYRAVSKYGLNNLEQHGYLYFEINQYLANETRDLLLSTGYADIQIRNDMNGNPRMIRARKSKNNQ